MAGSSTSLLAAACMGLPSQPMEADTPLLLSLFMATLVLLGLNLLGFVQA